MSYEILAKVKFNRSLAVVLNKEPVFKYTKRGSLIWGTDGIFYKCYKNEGMGETWKAFAGSKFNLTMEDGEIIECKGQWWDAGSSQIAKVLGIKLGSVTANTLDRLKKCYVYHGYYADLDKFNQLLEQYEDMPIIPCRDYEKIIKYDDMRDKYIKKIINLEHVKKSLIKEVKAKDALLKD